MKIVADSTFLIDLLRQHGGVENKLKALEDNVFFTTRINFFEIMVGVCSIKLEKDRVKRLKEALKVFDNIGILELDEKSAVKASQIAGELNRTGIQIEPNDCLTAGISIANGINTILTKNIKHFEHIKELNLETY